MKRLMWLALFLLCACSKNELKQEEQRLMAHDWVVSSFTIDPGWMHPQDSVLIVDMLAASEPCRLDDYYSFNRNGLYTHHSGALRCADGPASSNSSWTLSRNQGKLWLSIAATPYYEVEVTAIESNSMAWFVPFFSMGDGLSRTAVMTFDPRP